MQVPRLYVTAGLASGVELAATEAQSHYLANVLRRPPRSPVRLFNGRDGEWAAVYHPVRRSAVLSVGRCLAAQTPAPTVALLFAPLKRDATDLVVQKATELGAGVLRPVLTERGVASRFNAERAHAIAIEAAEQSERLTVPTIEAPVELAAALAAWPAEAPLAAAVERRVAPPPSSRSAGLLVGPEGGFTGRELDLLTRLPFVFAASLGTAVLRAETAAIAGLALILAGDR